jgi:hypothetical protein
MITSPVFPSIVPPFKPLPAASFGPEMPFVPTESVVLSPAAQQAAAQDRQNPLETAANGVNTGLDVVDSAATGGNRVISTAAQATDEAARGAAAGAGTAAKGLSTLSKVGKVAGPVGIGITAITSGAEAIGALRDPNLSADQKSEKVGGAVGSGLGSIGGGWGGAAAGAAIGAVGGPPGMIIGGIIGGVAGALGGGKIGEKIGGFLGDKLGDLL